MDIEQLIGRAIDDAPALMREFIGNRLQYEVAEILGLDPSVVSHILHHRRGIPKKALAIMAREMQRGQNGQGKHNQSVESECNPFEEL